MAVLLDKVWIIRAGKSFYPIQPSDKCKPEDHAALNDHITSIEEVDGTVLWKRPIH